MSRITSALATHRLLEAHLAEARALLVAAAAGDRLAPAAVPARGSIEDQVTALAVITSQAELVIAPVLTHLREADRLAALRAHLPVGAV